MKGDLSRITRKPYYRPRPPAASECGYYTKKHRKRKITKQRKKIKKIENNRFRKKNNRNFVYSHNNIETRKIHKKSIIESCLSPNGTLNLPLLLSKEKVDTLFIAKHLLGLRFPLCDSKNPPKKNIIKIIFNQYMKIKTNPHHLKKIQSAIHRLPLSPRGKQVIGDGERILNLCFTQINTIKTEDNKGFRYFLRDRTRFEIMQHKKSEKKETLFRENSFASLLFTHYQKIIFNDLLTCIIKKHCTKPNRFSLRKTASDSSSPKKIIKTTTAILKNLIQLLEKEVKTYKIKNPNFPKLRTLYSATYHSIKNTYDTETAERQILSVFIFRLIAPVMLTPRKIIKTPEWTPHETKYIIDPIKVLKLTVTSFKTKTSLTNPKYNFAKQFISSSKTENQLLKIISLLTGQKENLIS